MNFNLQTPWTSPNVSGHSIDPYTGEIDLTEGFGAFDSILSSYSLGRRAIDVGGGSNDTNAAYLFHKYQTDLMVYDPFMRSEAHNGSVMETARQRPFDAATSISVLNVIDNKDARIDHIRRCQSVIKEGGKAFFKVWPGNGSGTPEKTEGGFQNNRDLDSYLGEIIEVFGPDRVFIDNKNKIIKCVKSFHLTGPH
jgi:hypothetical protein